MKIILIITCMLVIVHANGQTYRFSDTLKASGKTGPTFQTLPYPITTSKVSSVKWHYLVVNPAGAKAPLLYIGADSVLVINDMRESVVFLKKYMNLRSDFPVCDSLGFIQIFCASNKMGWAKLKVN